MEKTTRKQLIRERDAAEQAWSRLMDLLDQIEIHENHTLASKRFEIMEECGYVIDFQRIQ